MAHLIRRSLPVKAFAFVTLLAVSGLSAQQPDDCEVDCHIAASHYYNALAKVVEVTGGDVSDASIGEAAQDFKDTCMELANC